MATKKSNISDYNNEFPLLTKEDLIARAKEANKDIEKENIHNIESIEKEVW